MPFGQNRLHAPLRLDGEWYLPQRPDHRLTGVLFFKRDRLQLKLAGSFREKAFNEFEDFPVILGQTTSGKKCTLRGCFEVRRSGGLSSPMRSLITANVLYLGLHFDPADEPCFSSVRVEYRGLGVWLNQKPISVDWPRDGSTSVVATCVAPPERRFEVHAISTALAIAGSVQSRGGGEFVRLRHTPHIDVFPEVPQDLRWYHDILIELGWLFTLLSWNPIGIDRLTIDLGQLNAATVHWPHRRPPSKRRLHGPYMLLSARQLDESLDSLINRWFQERESFRSCRALLAESMHSKGSYLYERFLNLVQAFESYSRARGEGVYLSKEDYEPIRLRIGAAIPAALDAELRRSIVGKIEHAYEYSLRRRLGEQLDRFESETSKLLVPKPQKFIGRVVDTRNYLTHLDDSSRAKALEGESLFWATEQLKLCLACLFMMDLGIDEALIRERLTQHYILAQYLRHFSADATP